MFECACLCYTHSQLILIIAATKEPIQSTLEPLARSIRVSFSTGNIVFALASTVYYIARSFISGKDIELLLTEVETLARQHSNHFGNDSSGKTVYNPLLQFYLAPIYNVLSEFRKAADLPSKRETHFPWDKVDLVENDQILKLAIEANQPASVHGILTYQTAKSLFCRDMESALKYTNMFSDHFMVSCFLQGFQLNFATC